MEVLSTIKYLPSWLQGPRQPGPYTSHGPSGYILRDKLIVVVDDDPTDRHLLSQAVQQEGATAFSARDGHAALRWFSHPKASFDAMILDHSLPDMRGTQLLHMLLEDGISIPVISVSAVARADAGMQMKELGVHKAINKPINKKEIIRALQEVIRDDERIHKPYVLDVYQLTRLRRVIDEIYHELRKIPPDKLAKLSAHILPELDKGRQIVQKGKEIDRGKLHDFLRFLRHPLTFRAFEDVGVSVVVRLLEGLARWP